MAEANEEAKVRKSEVAQQRILDSALLLFGARGYEQTTMRDIATSAGYSPGLTYRYFSCKEELVLVLYQRLAEELDRYVRALTPGPLVERFRMTVAKQLTLMQPYRETLAALFGTALQPRSPAGVFGESTAHIRRQARGTYLVLIEGAKDAPRAGLHADLATILYGAHLAMVLFWLIDQSPEGQRTERLLAFLQDMLKLLQPLFWLPVVSQALTRLARIIGPLLGADEDQPAEHASPVQKKENQP